MPKQLNVNLAFTADTAQAKQQIQQLKQSLQELNSNTIKNNVFSKMSEDVVKAQQSVQKLSSILDSSLNINTGRLDLSKFNQQLGSAGMSIQSLASDMTALGADGQKAFLNLANTIVTTQKPIMESSKLLDGMWTALKNTMRWQMSSSILHGLVSSIQGAYQYAQNLDKSLTDIAIVTGRSTDQMAEFAEQANKSAQALSVSTTGYTDAALIYYQQGLSDEEVQARTDTTMKLSNVTGQSAEEVSSYMTAIWNNFAEGSENLEHYADAITALGAHTASSSEEIAKGMQQFASVANTVGLSYEYAASALATIVAQTRQSESSVGNGLRTIFARLDSLKMGETLEDGVGLTKYTEALAKAGVQVLDQNGKLKDMNTILDEIGERWQALDATQKATLANTVGGVRQYSNLMALFDNYDKFKENVAVAQESDGSLQKQQDIYAEGWEAASKRVKAAWQAIYSDLIDDKFFKDLLDTFAKLLQGIDRFIDGIGGIPGVLSAVGVAITSLFGNQILSGIQNAQQKLKVFTGVAQKESDYMIKQTMDSLDNLIPFGSEDSADAMRVKSLKDQVNLNYNLKTAINDLANEQKNLTKNQLEYLNSLISTTQQYGEAAAKAREYQEAASEKITDTRLGIKASMLDKGDINSMGFEHLTSILEHEQGNEQFEAFNATTQKIADLKMAENFEEAEKATSNYLATLTLLTRGSGATAEQLKNLIKDTVDLKIANEQSANSTKNYTTQLNHSNLEIAAQKTAIKEGISLQEARIAVLDRTEASLKAEQQAMEQENQAMEQENQALKEEQELLDENPQRFDEINKKLEENSQKLEENTQKLKENQDAQKTNSDLKTDVQTGQIKKPPEDFSKGLLSPAFAKGVQTTFSGLSRLTMGINAVGTAIDILNDKKLDPFERLKKALPSLLMGIPALISGFTSLVTVIPGVKVALDAANGSLKTFFITLVSQPQFWIFMAIAAAIAGLIAVIKSANDAWNAEAKAAEEAAKKAEESKQAYEDLKNTFESLKSSLENHKSAVAALDDLKKGTEEWNEAVRQLNQDTLALIQQYPKLAQYVENVGGVLQLNEEGMQEYLNEVYEEMQNAAYQSIKDSKEAHRTDRISKETDIGRSINYGVAPQTDQYAAMSGEAPTTNHASTEEINKAIKVYNDTNGAAFGEWEDFVAALNNEGIKNEELIKALWNNKDSIEQLALEVEENQTADEALMSALIQSSIENQIGDEIKDLAGENPQIIGSIEGILEEEVQKGIENGKTLKEALLDIEKNFTEDADSYIKKAIDKLKSETITNVGDEFGTSGKIAIKTETQDWEDEKWAIASSVDPSQFDTVQQWIDKVNELYELTEHEIDLKIDVETLNNYKGKTEDLKNEVETLSKFIQENADDFSGLSEHIKECDAAAEAFAWSLIRFDDAMQDVSKNYEDWKTALEHPEDILGMSKAVTELRKTYGNLLDIDGSQLSEDFLKDAENLDKMNQVLTGTEEEAIAAYDELMKIAAIEIAKENAAKIGVEFDEEAFANQYDAISQMIDDLGLKAGDPIDISAPNFADLAAGLDSMLALVGNDMDAAKALFRQLGFQAEFENVPVKTEDEQDQQDLEAEFVEKKADMQGVTAISMNGLTAGASSVSGIMMQPQEPVPVIAQDLKYNARQKHNIKGSKTTNVGGLKIKDGSLHYIGGGSPVIKNSPTRNLRNGGGGSKGGSCFIAGTSIILKDSLKNIETIKPGDIVLSYDEKKKKNVFNEVLQTMIHFVHEKIYSLFIKDEKLKVTGNHKFLITRNNKQEWIQAADLKIGDLVLLSDGTLQKIVLINSELKHETVYNFEVSNTHNYYVGKNQILAHNKGGGGGGKNSTPKKQKREKPVQDKDRYHDIKSQIKDLTTEMSRLEKIRNRVWGKEKLKYMDQEIKNQEKQIELTKEYIKEAKNYLAEDKKRLDEIKMGAKYIKDESTGEWLLTNYEEVLQNIVDAQNKAVDEFNKAKERYENGEISEDELKAQEEAFNTDKENFEERKKILKQYEDTFNTVQEQVEKLIDDQWKLYDLKLEKVKVEVEVDLKMNDESRKLLEWSLKYMGDDLDRVSDKVANIGSQMRLWADDAETARSGIEKVFANHGVTLDLNAGGFDVASIESQLRAAMGSGDYSPMTQAEVEYIQEMMQTIRDSNDSLKEGWEQALDAWDTAMDRAWDTLSRQVGKYDRYEKTLETYKDVVALTGKNLLNISNKDLDALNKNLINNAQNRIRASRVEYQNALVQLEGAKKLLEEAEASGNETAIQTLTDRVHEAEEKMEEMMDGYADSVQEALQRVEDAWSDALDHMEEDYKNAFGDLGLDWYSDQFERQKELSELYLPDYKKYHELNKSMADLQKNIAQTNNQLIKGKGRELLADIAEKMKEGAQVSEYEAGIIQRRVELLKAEDELLAARNAKSAVRMTRDTEGNFSYTYTADESQIEQAQQGYSDAYYNLRDFQFTGEQDLEGSMLQKMDEYYQRVREIEETFRDNESGRAQALAALQSEYDQYISYYLNQFDVAYKWEGKLRNDDLADMQRVLGVKLDNFNQFVDSWQGTILNRIMPGYETLNGFVNNWKKASEDAVEAINVAHKNFVNNTELTFNAAGTTTELFKEGYNLAMEAVQQDSDNTTKEIAALGEQMVLSYAKGFDEVARFTKQYLEDWASNRASDQESMQSMDDLMRKLGELKTTAETKRTETEKQLTLLDGAVTTAVTKISESLDGISGAMNSAANAFNSMKDGWENFANNVKNTKIDLDVDLTSDKVFKGGMATGGYTGDWHSSEGRIALLHEKELVLNEEDTKNMLDAVGIIRSMVTNTGRSLGNIFNYSPLAFAGAGDTLQQQVHIDASFPNVTDHNEIELAINNLVNSASQYINRK